MIIIYNFHVVKILTNYVLFLHCCPWKYYIGAAFLLYGLAMLLIFINPRDIYVMTFTIPTPQTLSDCIGTWARNYLHVAFL